MLRDPGNTRRLFLGVALLACVFMVWLVWFLRRPCRPSVLSKIYYLSVHTVYLPLENATHMDEWLLHHLRVGVDHFFLYDNSPGDGSIIQCQECDVPGLNKYGEEYAPQGVGELSLVHARTLAKYKTFITVVKWSFLDKAGHTQMHQPESLSHYAATFGALSSWTAFIDMDEFLVPSSDLPNKLSELHKNGVTRVRVDQEKYASRFAQPRKALASVDLCWELPEDVGGEKYVVHSEAMAREGHNIHEVKVEHGQDWTSREELHFRHFNMNDKQQEWLKTAKGIENLKQRDPADCLRQVLLSSLPPSSPWARDRLTVVLTTAPNDCNTGLRIVRRTLESLCAYPLLRGARVIIGFDGFEVDRKVTGKALHSKCSRSSFSKEAYEAYKESLKAYTALLFEECSFVELPVRSCLTTVLRKSMESVRTPLVLIMQDDISLVQGINWQALLEAFSDHTEEFGIVHLRTGPSNRFHHDFEQSHCGRTALGRVLRHGPYVFTSCVCYSDQTQIASKTFYDQHVWPKVPDFDFMEHHLDCGRIAHCEKVWTLGERLGDEYYCLHNDGRGSCE